MSGTLKYLTDEDFAKVIAKGVTLVDFYADWCGPCRMIAPIVEELSNEMHGVATIAKIDIDKHQNAPSTYGVTSIPTIIIFKDGKEADRVVGVRDKEALKKLLNNALGH